MRRAMPISLTVHAGLLTALVMVAMPAARVPVGMTKPLSVVFAPTATGPAATGAKSDLAPARRVETPPASAKAPSLATRMPAKPAPTPPVADATSMPLPQIAPSPVAETAAESALVASAVDHPSPGHGAGGEPGVLTVSADMLSNTQDSAYVQTLFAWLEKHRQYPRRARLTNTEGTVLLRFRIDRAGRLLAWNVVKGSGSPLLDKAVEDMITAANPLPSVPADFIGGQTARSLEFVIPVEFRLLS